MPFHFPKTTRVIRAFSRKTDAVVHDYPLTRFDLESFRQVFKILDGNDPMYDCYEITPEIAEKMDPDMEKPPDWNFSEYVYFLETDAN